MNRPRIPGPHHRARGVFREICPRCGGVVVVWPLQEGEWFAQCRTCDYEDRRATPDGSEDWDPALVGWWGIEPAEGWSLLALWVGILGAVGGLLAYGWRHEWPLTPILVGLAIYVPTTLAIVWALDRFFTGGRGLGLSDDWEDLMMLLIVLSLPALIIGFAVWSLGAAWRRTRNAG